MHHGTANTRKETILLTKIGQLPILPRRKQRLRQFRDPDARILLLMHSVARHGRRYHMQCETLEDGAREVSFEPSHNSNKATLQYRPKRHFRDPFTGRLFFR
ncbi:MAG: hypothetical protein P4L70_00280 [Parasulfuritortus sp.]|nr:hypothetical protein [Parasulfuritortus sp.]